MPFKTHDDLGKPRGNTIIWRYMGLDKFLDLITHSRLFFANVQNLTDQYEVSLPSDLARRHVELTEKERSSTLTEEEQDLLKRMSDAIHTLALVNCWSLGRTESYALWKVYLGGAQAGVAIRTTLSSLRKAIMEGSDLGGIDIYTGEVEYTERLDEDAISVFSLVTMKREFYEYEKEVRLILLDSEEVAKEAQPVTGIPLTSVVSPVIKPSPGRYVKVDVPTLVGKLYLSPFMGAWFKDAIVEILKKVQPKLLKPTPEDRIVMSSILDI
jgi:hypothetical protein